MSKENLQQLIQEKILAAQLLEKQYGEFIPKSARGTLQKIIAAFTKSIANDGNITTSIQETGMDEDMAPQISIIEMYNLYNMFAKKEASILGSLLNNSYINIVNSNILLCKEKDLEGEANRKISILKPLANDLLQIIRDNSEQRISITIDLIRKKLYEFVNIIGDIKKNVYKKDLSLYKDNQTNVNNLLNETFQFSSIIIEELKKVEEKQIKEELIDILSKKIENSELKLKEDFQNQINNLALNSEAAYEELLTIINEMKKQTGQEFADLIKKINNLKTDFVALNSKVIEYNNESKSAIKAVTDIIDVSEQGFTFINQLADFNDNLQYTFVFSEKENFFKGKNKQFRMPLLTRVLHKQTQLKSGNCTLTNPQFKVLNTTGTDNYTVKQLIEFEYDLIFDEIQINEEKNLAVTISKWVSNVSALGLAVAAIATTGGTAAVALFGVGSAGFSFASNLVAEDETKAYTAIKNIRSGKLKLYYELNYRYASKAIIQNEYITCQNVIVSINFISGKYKEKEFTLQQKEWANCFKGHIKEIQIARNL